MTARPRSDFTGLTLSEVLAQERLSRDQAAHRAALVVAHRSADATDCRELLAMLGLLGADPGTEAGPPPHLSARVLPPAEVAQQPVTEFHG